MTFCRTAEERDAYDPGPCPTCGSTDVRVGWVDVSDWSVEPGTVFMPGSNRCLNKECPARDWPTCPGFG